MKPPPHPRSFALACLTAAGLMLGGCGETTTMSTPATESPSDFFSAPAGGERTGAVATSAPSGTSFSFKSDPGDDGGVDFAAYDESIDLALGAISEYWIETLPNEFGVEWVQPDEFIAYYPPEEEGPECGGEPVGPVNAVYCYQGDSDFIAWDEPGLMLPFYEQFGDMADAVVLAHEFGHGAQARLGLSDQFPLTIEAELQADCFAGAWAAWADEQGLLGRDAADQAVDAVVSVADPEGVPWNDPQAHGTAEERLTAFADGFDGGAGGCYDYYAPGFSQG